MPPIFDAYQASVRASTAAWTVSGAHQPAYSSGKAGNNPDRARMLQPGVDLLLSGHDHHMEHVTTRDGYNIGIMGASGNGLTPIFSPVWAACSATTSTGRSPVAPGRRGVGPGQAVTIRRRRTHIVDCRR
ncbi:hypothetical protein ABN034_12745 [Actinopolymorpha sp. B11F2]|uniref:hypothetical protein n=1 Tax=Actinopolymorpha sp. B11F2 TaxID=3160862 RepID=UPI0032E38889